MSEGMSVGQPRQFADVVVLAAGRSVRMGGPDKLFLDFAGRPLLAWTVAALSRAESVRRLIIVTRPDRVTELMTESWVREAGASVVAGGDSRQVSVAAGVEASTSDVVLIHDGARPLVTPEVVDRVARAALTADVSVPVVPVPESMLWVADGRVTGELDKIDLYKSQTPHGLNRRLLLAAYAQQDPRGPEMIIDEPSLVLATTGTNMTTVAGDAVNLKVTVPGDEELGLALLEARARATAGAPSAPAHSGAAAPGPPGNSQNGRP